MINCMLAACIRWLLRLRYRTRVRGLRAVARRGRRGILFLPNHPALIDPILLMARLYGRFAPRALADERQVNRFFIRWLAKRADVMTMPDVLRAGPAATGIIRRRIARCAEALRNGRNVLLYPAGRVYRQRCEDLASASVAAEVVAAAPGARVVLIRTTGLWGSGFSWASGTEPNVAAVLKRGLWGLLVSGIFFAPRRRVEITVEEPADLPSPADRAAFNRRLEEFYNAQVPPNTFVPYSVWRRGERRELPEPSRGRLDGDPLAVPDAVRRQVCEQLEELTGVEAFSDDSRLAHDLVMDSLQATELLAWLRGEFGFAPADAEDLRTVGDVMLAAAGEQVAPARPPVVVEAPRAWFRRRPQPNRPDGLAEMTIPQAVLHQARRFADCVIAADATSGAVTYRRLLAAATALRPAAAALAGDRVGVMMPASVAADVLVLTTMLAGRTAVMVNWTLGVGVLAELLDGVGVQRVLTSRRLLDRLAAGGVDLGALAERLVCIEDLRAALSRGRKLAAAVRTNFGFGHLDAPAAAVPAEAVVLFTSGSETRPKAVPLTHRNILSNVADAWELFDHRGDEAICGFLPPFHAFGLTTSMILPLVTGIPVVHSPNPADGAALAAVAGAYRPNIAIGTPTFLAGMVRAAEAGQLSSLRIAVSGAEACPERLRAALAAACPQLTLMEGYGITECGPIVSCNREGDARAGTVGPPLASVNVRLVDAETHEPVPRDRRGMLLVCSPSVFDGYLNYDGPSPFVEADGRRWYRTGDLLDLREGHLLFAGRLKRFVKIGGEMVSLPAVEAALADAFAPADDKGPVLGVVADESGPQPQLVLFTMRDITRQAANDAIRATGLSALHNIRRVQRVAELPLLGTGKIDVRALQRRLTNGDE